MPYILLKVGVGAMLAFLGSQDPNLFLYLLGPMIASALTCQIGKAGISMPNLVVMYLVAFLVGTVIAGLFALLGYALSKPWLEIAYMGHFVGLILMVATQDRVQKDQPIEA
jgi:hypothetical protein